MKEHKAKKRLGQNFLQDMRIITDTVNAVHPQADDVVVEVDPGSTATIEPLVKRLNRLHTIEIDHGIIGRLETLPLVDKLAIHEGDMLQFDFNGIVGKKKIIGSLPYSTSTPLLFKLAETADDAVEVYSMLRKEAVERMVTASRGNNHGRLGAMLRYFFNTELLIDAPPESFDPAPKAGSAVVCMIPVEHRIGKANDFGRFAELVKLAFHQRRKAIRNNLREFAGGEDLQVVGISPRDRAKRIAPEKYVELSNYLVREAI